MTTQPLLPGTTEEFVSELLAGAKIRRSVVVSNIDQLSAQYHDDQENNIVPKFVCTAAVATLLALWDDPHAKLGSPWRVIEIPDHVASIPSGNIVQEMWSPWIVEPEGEIPFANMMGYAAPCVVVGIPIWNTQSEYHQLLNDSLMANADRFQEAASEINNRYLYHESLIRERTIAENLIAVLGGYSQEEEVPDDEERATTTL